MKTFLKFSSTVFLLCTLYAVTNAQPFTFDKQGYVSSPKFIDFIKQKGYALVGKFDTLSTEPLDIRAEVIYRGEWRYINQYGELIEKEEFDGEGEYYPFTMSDDIDIENILVEAPPMSERNNKSQSDPYEIVRVDGKYGTKHKESGKEGLSPIYDLLTLYGNGLIGIKKDGKQGMAYSDGSVFIEPEYDYVSTMRMYRTKGSLMFKVNKGGKFGVIDSLGNVLFKPEYDYINECMFCGCPKGAFMVKFNNKWTLYSIDAKPLHTKEYDNMIPFVTGFFKAKSGNPAKYDLLDCEGNVLLEGQAAIDYSSSERFITFVKDGLWGKMKLDGTIFLHQVYGDIKRIDSEKEFIVVMKDGKYGLLNKKEEFVIKPLYDEVQPIYSLGLVSVSIRVEGRFLKYKNGYVDFKGKEIIKVEYDEVYRLNANLYFFNKDTVYGLMNKKEKVIKYYEYDRVTLVSENLLKVRKKGEEGFIDREGKVLLPIKYDYIKDGYDFHRRGYCRAKLNGQYYWVDRYGNEALDTR